MAICVGNGLLDGWLDKQQKAGLLPKRLRRVIIDIAYDDVVKVYIESLGDEAMFDVSLATVVEGAKVVRAEDTEEVTS